MQEKIDLFSKLLRKLESEIGTRDVADLILRALIKSIEDFSIENADEFCNQFCRLKEILSQTEPKFGILNYYFASLTLEFQKTFASGKFNDSRWKHVALKKVKQILKESKHHKTDILRYAEKLNVEGKTILIHDHSHTVQDVLLHLKKMGQNFKVVIAEQDFEKTHGNIEAMHNAKIPFQVVPSYMLSHIHEQIDMLFFGALTLKDTMDFVMDPGTHGTISEFHIAGVPIYMFIDTTKFSLWKSKKRGEIFMRKHSQKHHSRPIEYERIKYSHDRVPVKLFKKIITNEGIFDQEGIEKLFRKQYENYQKVCC